MYSVVLLCRTPQEAAWAISNATSGGKPEQIKYLVTEGCIPPLSDLLEVHDPKIVTVALEGLENILKVRNSRRDIFLCARFGETKKQTMLRLALSIV